MAPSSSSGRAASRSAKTSRARERVGVALGVPSPVVGLIREGYTGAVVRLVLRPVHSGQQRR